MTSHKPRHTSHGPPTSGDRRFGLCAVLCAAASSQKSGSSSAQLPAPGGCSELYADITERNRTVPQEFRCPTTSCPQPQLICSCLLLTAVLGTAQGLSQLVVRGAGRTAKWPPGLSEGGAGAALSGSSFSLSLPALREHFPVDPLSCRATAEPSMPALRRKLSPFSPIQSSRVPQGVCKVIHLGVGRKC